MGDDENEEISDEIKNLISGDPEIAKNEEPSNEEPSSDHDE